MNDAEEFLKIRTDGIAKLVALGSSQEQAEMLVDKIASLAFEWADRQAQ